MMRRLWITATALLGAAQLTCAAVQAATETNGTVQVQGRQHTFSIVAPDAARSGRRYPIVMALHGGGGDGRRAAMVTGLGRYVDREGFIAVFPDAGDRPWNDGRETTRGFSGDVAVLRAIVQQVVQSSNGDPKRVFVTGISNGGMMVQRLACEASDLFTAYAAVVANLPSALAGKCNPRRPTPMLLISGTDDRLMPYRGGDLPQLARRRDGAGVGGRVESAPESGEFWAAVNGCSGSRAEQLPDTRDDATRVTVHKFTGCRSGAQVIQYEIQGGGHNWPGGPSPNRPRLQRLIGNVSQDINATAVVLDFFRQYGL